MTASQEHVPQNGTNAATGAAETPQEESRPERKPGLSRAVTGRFRMDRVPGWVQVVAAIVSGAVTAGIWMYTTGASKGAAEAAIGAAIEANRVQVEETRLMHREDMASIRSVLDSQADAFGAQARAFERLIGRLEGAGQLNPPRGGSYQRSPSPLLDRGYADPVERARHNERLGGH